MEELSIDKDKLDINKLYELISDTYNTSVVAEVFCNNFPYIEEISYITPIIRMLHQKLDKANAMLIDCMPASFD